MQRKTIRVYIEGSVIIKTEKAMTAKTLMLKRPPSMESSKRLLIRKTVLLMACSVVKTFGKVRKGIVDFFGKAEVSHRDGVFGASIFYGYAKKREQNAQHNLKK